MNEQQVRWDDLRIVQAIAETGTLSGAGRRLGMSHATVFRRLQDMEQRLGVALFDRSRTGYAPTMAGDDLAMVATRVESDILGAERRIAGQDLRLSGSLRVTTTDTLFAGALSSIFEDFRNKYMEIELEVVISNQVRSLGKREADLAIRPTRNPPEVLVGRRVGAINLAVYGLREHWQQSDLPGTLAALSPAHWIGPDPHMGDASLEAWMNADNQRARCHYRVDSMLAMQYAVRQGSGVAVLPCYLGDEDPLLARLTQPIAELSTPLWLLTHPDLRKVTRIRTFMDEVGDALRHRLSRHDETVAED